MKPIFGIILLVTLSACGEQIVILPPETPPTVVSPTLVPTSTLIPVTDIPTPLPTPLPTLPIIPMITPDAIQVKRWNEYEDALVSAIFKSSLQPEEVVCEWEILGRAKQEVYVSTFCASIYSAGSSQASMPAVINIGTDGTVQSVEIPGAGSDYARDISQMFPLDVQEKFENYHFGRTGGEMSERIKWRRTHPEEPPLIVLIATPIP